ncbi:hypothetical protein DM02DRAFT_471379, partial [Periconia macrospinosa]
IKAVRINCLGDVKVLERPRFEAVEIQANDTIFVDRNTSAIAQRIDIPIFTRRLPHTLNWSHPDPDAKKKLGSSSGAQNQDATFLHLCCDPNAEPNYRAGFLGWGRAPIKWENDVGSVVVVRQDKKPLTPFHVEVLCGYAHNRVKPLFLHSMGRYGHGLPLSKDAVLTMICRATFVIYWFE